MFYSEAILSRRGPLARVWLAAHMERKLSKTQTLQTDIEESVEAIMGQEIEIMALRLSGQLLLGVVRIYSRKAKYLLDDCNEALLKIKMAFRPGIVDMTEDQMTVNRNAITLQQDNVDLDLLIPDVNWDFDFEERPQQPQGQHVARAADITLASANDVQLDLDDPGYGFDLGPADGIGSQDFDLDLGLDFGDGPAAQDENREANADETMSVEIGRDAAAPREPRESLDSHLLGKDIEADFLSHRSGAPSEHEMDLDFGGDMGGMDLDLGISFDDAPLPVEPEGENLPNLSEANLAEANLNQAEQSADPTAQRKSPSRASSPLSTPPPSPQPATPKDGEPLTEDQAQQKTKKRHANKKQIIDDVTELQNGPGMRIGRGRNGMGSQQDQDVSGIITEQHFLPRSYTVMRLMEIRRDPLAHFLPTKVTPNGTYFCAGPPGLAPELAELFMRPVFNSANARKRGASPEKVANKRQRLDGSVTGEDELEQARRAESRAPSVAVGSEVLGRGSMGPGLDLGEDSGMNLGMDDYQLDLNMDMGGDMDLPPLGDEDQTREKSRMSTPAADLELPIEEGMDSYADVECPIAMFDDRSAAQSQGQTQSSDGPPEPDAKGYSKNTAKAVALIRKELAPTTGAGPSDNAEKVMSFQQISHKATKRAASSFFFELLVLSTRDVVKVVQPTSFENIEIRATDKLWEHQRFSQSQSQSQSRAARSSSAAASASQ